MPDGEQAKTLHPAYASNQACGSVLASPPTMRGQSMVKVRFVCRFIKWVRVFWKHLYEEKGRLPLVVYLVSFMVKTV